ncbi:MAG: type II secretion system F family protein [Candidatus Pacearchaeota archaeon]|jgi:Flp pilus assembly protein TadB
MAIDELKANFEREKKIADQISSLTQELNNSESDEERRMISSQINILKSSLRKSSQGVVNAAENISMPNPLPTQTKTALPVVKAKPAAAQTGKPVFTGKVEDLFPAFTLRKQKVSSLEKDTIKRLKKKEVVVAKKKEKTPSVYVKFASNLFYKRAEKQIKKGSFYNLRRDLIKGNLDFVPESYISVIYFTTLISFIASIFVMIFFLFFDLIATPPFLVATKTAITTRFLETFWILIVLPAIVFIFAYFYPTLEKRSLETRINEELPFAVIHMSSVSRSMIEPSKIFSIIIATGEYPHLEKEFTKLFNDVNIYGYDLVTALRDMAFNSPSRKLSDLYNGLATTITSGGDLPEFFDKRAQTLLFDHRLETEKHAKAAETFMDIYISVVIASPMILMLLLVMMSASGLGLSLSTSMISLIMVLAVTLMNVLFLVFLHLKQPGGE